jgi:hypothetical protein
MKPKHGKALKELVIDFSGALDPGTADDLGAYVLDGAKRVKKRGLVYVKSVPLASASYDPADKTVILIPRGKLPKQGMQLAINADLVPDAAGQPLGGSTTITIPADGRGVRFLLKIAHSSQPRE